MSRAGAGVGVSEERWYSSGGSLIEAVLYTYDDDGNRTSRTTSAGVEQYHYGVGWRLTSIERASTTTEAFTYDDAGRVTSLTRDGHSYALSHNVTAQRSRDDCAGPLAHGRARCDERSRTSARRAAA